PKPSLRRPASSPGRVLLLSVFALSSPFGPRGPPRRGEFMLHVPCRWLPSCIGCDGSGRPFAPSIDLPSPPHGGPRVDIRRPARCVGRPCVVGSTATYAS